MPNLQPYRDLLKRLGFKENPNTENLWEINTCDMETGQEANAGVNLGFYDEEKKVGVPALYTENGEINDPEAYNRSANLKDFYMEREALIEQEKTSVKENKSNEVIISVEEAFSEPRKKTPYNLQQPTAVVGVPMTEEVPRERAIAAIRQKIEELKRREVKNTQTIPNHPPEIKPNVVIQQPQIVYKVDKEKILSMKNDSVRVMGYEIEGIEKQIEAVKEEIEERRKEDEARLKEFEDKLSFLEVKWKIVQETYEKILKELG